MPHTPRAPPPQRLLYGDIQAQEAFDGALAEHLAGKTAGLTGLQPYVCSPGSHAWFLRTEWVHGEAPRGWVVRSQLPYPTPGGAPGSFIAATVSIATDDPERPLRTLPVDVMPVDLPTADPRYRAVFPMLEDLVAMMTAQLDLQFMSLTAEWVQDVTGVWFLVQVRVDSFELI